MCAMPEAATVSVMPSPLVLTTPLSFTTSACDEPVPVELAVGLAGAPAPPVTPIPPPPLPVRGLRASAVVGRVAASATAPRARR